MPTHTPLEEVADRLTELRGTPLVEAIAAELASLGARLDRLEATVKGLQDFGVLRQRLESIDALVAGHLPLPRSVDLRASENLAGQQGFYPVEFSGDGKPYRWTGPETFFSFEVVVDRAVPLQLALHIMRFVNYGRQRDLSLLVDGDVVAGELRQSGKEFVLEAVLPEREAKGTTEVVVILPRVEAPADTGDPRLLGLAFTRLTLRPAGGSPAIQK